MQLPVKPWPLPGRAALGRTVHGLDAGEDEIDAGQELLAVVMFEQLCPGFVHGWVSGGVELRPLCGDDRIEQAKRDAAQRLLGPASVGPVTTGAMTWSVAAASRSLRSTTW